MTDLPSIWDDFDEFTDRYFTIGRGKRHYHIWTCGVSGLYYCYHIADDGICEKKRAVEPTAMVKLHIVGKTMTIGISGID